MRLVVALLVTTSLVRPAAACPDQVPTEVSTDQGPSTASPCLTNVDFSARRMSLDVRYAVGAGGIAQTGTSGTARAFAGLELGYAVGFGGDEDPSYEIELVGGATGQRIGGEVDATGLVTSASARIGPGRVRERVIDEGRSNFAMFPLTMELAHVGEVAARPRIAARPEMARSLYDRERVALTTRVLRVEGAGETAQTTAPGATIPKKPTSWALDFIPLHSDVDVAVQDGTRVEAAIGGALLGVTEHTTAASVDILGIEHRRIDLAMTGPTDLDTLWVLRLDAVNPATGTRYFMGWGSVIAMPDRDELARRIDPEGGDVTIGGLGWFASRAWGGYGAQYKREPFVAMTGAVALEDRVSGEVFVPRALGLVAAAFAARTTRLVDDELQHENTAGVALDTSYDYAGVTSKLALELGRTFYPALDGGLPQNAAFAASVGLTIQHAGAHTWMR